MHRLFLLFIAMLASAGSWSALAETKKKSPGSAVSPTPRPKPKTSESTTPRPSPSTAKKSATPKSTPGSKTKTTDDSEPAATPKPEPSAIPRPPEASAPARAPAATLATGDLREFDSLPPRVQQLLSAALALTPLNLTYTFGSADPGKGGMDCSGTMYYVLRSQGVSDVPRDSAGQYAWARKRGPFFAVVSKSADSFEFDDLRPGDLLFWTGTYDVQREIPISHVMLYLGTEKKTKKRVMFGASDGRSYAGVQRWGVSVFDFKMPREGSNGSGSRVDFVGYARIPGLAETGATLAADARAEPAPAEATATPKPSASKAKTSTTKRPKKSSAGSN